MAKCKKWLIFRVAQGLAGGMILDLDLDTLGICFHQKNIAHTHLQGQVAHFSFATRLIRTAFLNVQGFVNGNIRIMCVHQEFGGKDEKRRFNL